MLGGGATFQPFEAHFRKKVFEEYILLSNAAYLSAKPGLNISNSTFGCKGSARTEAQNSSSLHITHHHHLYIFLSFVWNGLYI